MRTKASLHQTKMRIILNLRAPMLHSMITRCSRLRDKEMTSSINSTLTIKILRSSLTKFLPNSTRSNLKDTFRMRLREKFKRMRTLLETLRLTTSHSIWKNWISSECRFPNLISWVVQTKMKRPWSQGQPKENSCESCLKLWTKWTNRLILMALASCKTSRSQRDLWPLILTETI